MPDSYSCDLSLFCWGKKEFPLLSRASLLRKVEQLFQASAFCQPHRLPPSVNKNNSDLLLFIPPEQAYRFVWVFVAVSIQFSEDLFGTFCRLTHFDFRFDCKVAVLRQIALQLLQDLRLISGSNYFLNAFVLF